MQNFKFPLVTAIDGEARASSLVIASGLGQSHHAVMQLLRKYAKEFNEFNHLHFKCEMVSRKQGGGRKVEYAMLNEHQASLLIAFMRNPAACYQMLWCKRQSGRGTRQK